MSPFKPGAGRGRKRWRLVVADGNDEFGDRGNLSDPKDDPPEVTANGILFIFPNFPPIQYCD